MSARELLAVLLFAACSDRSLTDSPDLTSDLAVRIVDFAAPIDTDLAVGVPDLAVGVSDGDPCGPVRACLSAAYAELNTCCPGTTTCNAQPPVVTTAVTLSSTCSAACTANDDSTYVIGSVFYTDTLTWTATAGAPCGSRQYEHHHGGFDKTTLSIGSHSVDYERWSTGWTVTWTVTCDGVTVSADCSPYALGLSEPVFDCKTPEPGCTLPGLDR